jgi:REP-associated tyrosine transposase
MPRHARLRVGGLPLHVYQRGVNRCACFGGDGDRNLYLSLLEELSREHGCAIHAYVLMTNHVHLLLTPEPREGVSALMKNLGQRYVQRFNKCHERTGTLWEGRFHSSLIDSQGYLFHCYRYVESNPVRARMVEHARDYPWTSYRCNAEGEHSRLITPHPLYDALATTRAERIAEYRRLFEVQLSEEEIKGIRDAARGGYALGRAAFLSELERTTQRRVTRAFAGRPRENNRENNRGQTSIFRSTEN